MQTSQLVGSAAVVLLFGTLIGVAFDFAEGRKGKGIFLHIIWGIGAASLGWLVGALIPLSFSNEHRVYAIIGFGTLIPLDVMIGRWMISKAKMPMIEHLDHYPEDIKKDVLQHGISG